ncbi:MAG: hypothetical protein HDS08_06535 [Bacteroides sp.]|nr:hypothetical protein [Bacteroides sp.]
MQYNTNDNHDYDKVASLLTPRHPRRCEFAFYVPSKKRVTGKIFAISSVAAMIAVVVTIAIKSVMPVSAAEVINSAITGLTDAENIRVEFEWRGTKNNSEEIYTPDSLGNIVNGTLYILRKNGKVNTRIDWHDVENNSIIFNGRDYIHLRNNEIIDKHPSSFGEELIDLFSQNSLSKNIKDNSVFSTEGDFIIAESHKGDITFHGEFRKDSKRLTKASVSVSLQNGQDLKMMETTSIATNISITELMFIE